MSKINLTSIKRASRTLILCSSMTAFSAFAAGQDNATRAVPSAPVMQDIPDAHEKPDPGLHYKLVFDVQTMGDSSDDASPALRTIGAVLNTYRKFGVPSDHIQATAVFHGKTILLVTTDQTYQHRSGTPKNPNAALLHELASAGVDLVICGQSARSQHYTNADILPFVTTNLSATVTFINLQTRGFIKITE